jgi:outer membrane protein assembly factor BamB
VVWQRERDEPTTWATPLIVDRQSQRQVITCGTNRIRSYDLETGEVIWESTGLTLNAIPSPVLNGDQVICMSGFQGSRAVSIDLPTSKAASGPDLKWQLDQDTPYVPSPLLTHGRLYFTKSNSAILTCVDAKNGKPVFATQRLTGLDNLYASPVATDRHIYFASREGTTLVIKNQPTFEIVAKNQLPGPIDASPAIVGKQIFLRTKSHLYCVQEE